MPKILIMTDSACDLEINELETEGIKLMSFNVSIDDISFRETVDKSKDEVYRLMDNSSEIPKTSQVTQFEFLKAYKEAYSEGYTDIIYMSISATASKTYENSIMAKNMFFDEVPEAKGKIDIYVVDSKGYTAMYGYPLLEASKKVKKADANAKDIVAYLEEWASKSAAYFVPMTLKYAKKSGRISAAVAFAGELLGIKPIIQMADGGSKIMTKIRGDKNIIPKLMECIEAEMTPQTPYVMLMGKNDTLAKQLEKEMIKKFGYKAEYYAKIGASISANAGNDLVGVACRRKNV